MYFFQKFLQPLFEKPEVCEENLVRFMLYKLPEILKFHQNFLLKLDAVVHLWSDKSRIGPLLLETVSHFLIQLNSVVGALLITLLILKF